MTTIAEPVRLGVGTFGCVTREEIGGKDRAVKVGKLGPLEENVLSCGSKAVPTLVVGGGGASSLEGRVVMKLAPGKMDKRKAGAFRLFKGLFEALIDINDKCRERGIIPHDTEVVHRDLKPSNIGYSKSGVLKILDWGSATVSGVPRFKPQKSSGGRGRRIKKIEGYSPQGTPGFIPLESYFKEYPITSKFDSWALGIMLYQILSGKVHPLSADNFVVLSLKINSMAVFPDTDEFRDIRNSDSAQEARREVIGEFQTSLDDVVRDESIPGELYEVMKGLLRADPSERLSVVEALEVLNSVGKLLVSPASVSRTVESTTMSSSDEASEHYTDEFEIPTVSTDEGS